MATGQSVRIALVNQIRTRTGVSIVAMNTCSITYIQPQNQELSFRPARRPKDGRQDFPPLKGRLVLETTQGYLDRKSTRLNSSHTVISYAVFCLKKKTDKISTL